MGWVYAIASDDRPLIKIGRTDRDDVEDRLRQLQTGQPDKLRIVWAWQTPDSRALEAAMHALLHPHHHRGEWFTITPEQAARAYTEATGEWVIWPRVARWCRRRAAMAVRMVRRGCTLVGAMTVTVGVVVLATHL